MAGRTEAKIKEAAQKLSGNTTSYVLDIGKTDYIGPFIQQLLKEHLDVDLLINNSVVLRLLVIINPNLKVEQEIDIVRVVWRGNGL